MFSLLWAGRRGPRVLCAVVRWARQCYCSRAEPPVGSSPFKPEGGKQGLLGMHPWGGGLCPTRAAGVLGHEDKISCLQKKNNVFKVLQGR